MLLNGITGFHCREEDKPPNVNGEKYKSLCFSLARLIDEKVIAFTDPQYPTNFYKVKLSNDIYILLNAHYPYISFATFVEYGKVVFINESTLYKAFSSSNYRVLTTTELNKPLRLFAKSGQVIIENGNNLNEAELSQIKQWRPKTIGEIIYNFWD